MDRRALQSDLLLLLASAIWGTAFVAQRVGMEHIGPFLFNGIRFALGALVLVPFIARQKARGAGRAAVGADLWALIRGGVPLGAVLFVAANFQQVGLVETTAGKAGFITGLYVVITPILGLAFGQRTRLPSWIGAVVAVVGLYLLSVTSGLHIARGDLLVLFGAFVWALHVLMVGRLSPRHAALPLAATQFVVCSVLSLLVSAFLEEWSLASVWAAAVPLLYGGCASVGIAYTLQVIAQRHAPATHAAIILSLESPFAAIGGFLMLGEILTARGLVGCALMLSGMLISQIAPRKTRPRETD